MFMPEGKLTMRDERINAGSDVDLIPADLLCNDAEEPGDQDAPEDSTRNAAIRHGADDEEADEGEDELRRADSTEVDQRRIAGNDDACALQSDDDDEETDTCRDTVLESGRNVVDELLTEARERKQNEDDTFDEDGCESDLPRIVDAGLRHRDADRIREISIQSHAGSEGDRIIRHESHEQCREDCRDDRGGEDGIRFHAGSREDVRVDREDVDHREEGGDSGDDLRSHGCTVLLELKKLFHE